jgi:hypothetical protein
VNTRVIVAGGGGNFHVLSQGGFGGGIEGGSGANRSIDCPGGTGETQASPGYAIGFPATALGAFGSGGDASGEGCGGCGGWFGGGGGEQGSAAGGGGWGGCGFVLGPESVLPTSYRLSKAVFAFLSASMIAGNGTMPSAAGEGEEEEGHSGNGAIRITFIEVDPQQRFCRLSPFFCPISRLFSSFLLFFAPPFSEYSSQPIHPTSSTNALTN